jgi:hypothetical protein
LGLRILLGVFLPFSLAFTLLYFTPFSTMGYCLYLIFDNAAWRGFWRSVLGCFLCGLGRGLLPLLSAVDSVLSQEESAKLILCIVGLVDI